VFFLSQASHPWNCVGKCCPLRKVLLLLLELCGLGLVTCYNLELFLKLWIISTMVGFLERGISPTQGRLPTQDSKKQKGKDKQCRKRDSNQQCQLTSDQGLRPRLRCHWHWLYKTSTLTLFVWHSSVLSSHTFPPWYQCIVNQKYCSYRVKLELSDLN
jgi:hypothetical protein